MKQEQISDAFIDYLIDNIVLPYLEEGKKCESSGKRANDSSTETGTTLSNKMVHEDA